jgi:DNA-binding MarR family transcriptional regulator
MSDTDNSNSNQPNHEPAIPRESYDLRILQSLRRIIRAIDIHSHRLAHVHNITGPQLGCLLAVKESGPLTSGSVARKIYLSPSTVVGIIDRLEKKGLVTRTRDNRDRRQVYVTITPKGEGLIADTPALMQETLAKAILQLPELEQVSIAMALERLTELMEAQDIKASPILETGSLTSE